MASTATQYYVSGPAEVWLGIGASYAWVYLGWTESGVTIAITPFHEDINVDFAGAMPGAVSQLGEEARISGTFTRYNEACAMQAASFYGLNGIPGSILTNMLGGLLFEEGLSYPLLIQSPYWVKSVFSAMVPGFWFFNTYLVDPHEAVYSIRAKKPTLAWRAIPVFGTNGGSFSAGQPPFNASQLYTNTLPESMPPTT